MNLSAFDCSPLEPQPTAEQVGWLQAIAQKLKADQVVVALGGSRKDDEPIVYCERDGSWWAGRYVGSITGGGMRLTIQPRLGLSTISSWLSHITGAVLADTPGKLRDDIPFVVQLLAVIWSGSLIEAARHGLPALRRETKHVGTVVRGRLDVFGSTKEWVAGRTTAASLHRERSLDNPISRMVIAAYGVLRRWMGPGTEGTWLPERAKELLPHLLAVTGARPPVPSDADCSRVRYTPITAGFKNVMRFSKQIILRRGLFSDMASEGDTQGVLLDVAELWELYVLAAIRRAATGLEVVHGTTRTDNRQMLLSSERDGRGLGELRPDCILRRSHDVKGIVDAKYKSLWPNIWTPVVPQRNDLFQLTTYLSGFGRERPIWGALVYPHSPDRSDVPPVEAGNPWSLDQNRKVWLLTLPHEMREAVNKLRSVLFGVATL